MPAEPHSPTLVEVAVPLPLPRTFTYRLDGGAVEDGTRVRVRFGGRRLLGWVVGPASAGAAPEKLRAVEEVLEVEPSLPGELLRLCRWIADYYLAPLGQVIRTALPSALSDTARSGPPVKTRRMLRLTRELPSLTLRDEVFGRARRQRELFEFLEAMGGLAESAHLAEQAGFSHAVQNGLVHRALAAFVDEELSRDPFLAIPVAPPPALTLTPAQARAVGALVGAARGAPTRPYLLRGVTGSGKTLVYIELLKEVVERQGRGAIVLVPEIALTPQTVARFRAHFGDAVAVLHSALSDGERFDAWRALRRREKRIAVGARSAIFAPIADLGAIVIDEEHEGSYKQSEAPRYHAREVAIMRARLCGAVCVLGSATPALESWHNAQRGKFELLELPERVEGRPLPPVEVVDLRGQKDGPEAERASGRAGEGGKQRSPTPPLPHSSAPMGGSPREDTGAQRPRIAEGGLSARLVDAMRLRLERGEQTILLLNRRGYSTFVQCRDCGAVWHCANCNVSLTYHRTRRRMVCHYCFHEEPPPVTCDACGSGDLSFRGLGTEQVERTVTETFPDARVARMDVDTTSAKWAHHDILSRVERGEVDILLGTQMIAKGLDFPGVTLVGVINADVGMNLPDFRASERTFQLLTQVSGRAGRGPRGGDVIVQTALPGHYAIRAAIDHDFATFAERELEERRGPNYPPHSRLLNVVVSGTAEIAVQEAAVAAAAWVRGALEAEGISGVEVIGPAPCPVDRIRNRWRWHFLLRAVSPGLVGRTGHRIFRQYALKPGAAELRLVLDRDPVSLL